ncbi:MAG: SMP-30/gluconolactonase/LRE family protein [Clostridia bacterium]|nr:SMP-30/gluconolactonase/LRE family protein [Clostridia bacterium]
MYENTIECIRQKRCTIGEGPIWNEKEKRLYFTNGLAKEMCILDVYTGDLTVRSLSENVSAFCFDRDFRLIVARQDGVFYLKEDGSTQCLYDREKYDISYANDMKTGPDGRIYVGTQSGARLGISDKRDGKLYRIDEKGQVTVLLEGLALSNGLEWSLDESKFYHTDSCTGIIREYDFDCVTGGISPTGRQIEVPGVDGFTIDKMGHLLVACWGYGRIAVLDTNTLSVTDEIKVPALAPASCGFCGNDMEFLAVVTAQYGLDTEKDPGAGFAYLYRLPTKGRKPYLFG